jgi:hypothetical protein
MMGNQTTDTITCPSCGIQIPLSSALTHQLRDQVEHEFAKQLQERERQFAAEKEALAKHALEKAQAQLALELKDLRESLAEKQKHLDQAQQAELELRKEKRDLEDKRATLELDTARRLDQERGKIEQQARQTVIEEQQLKLADKEKLITDLQKQIELLRQKADQGPQQRQGTVLEERMENSLREKFPHDEIAPIDVGARGADILQTVRTSSGRVCGSILWETKRTRSWSNCWIDKLKEDQRAQRADLAVLLSVALPEEIKSFDQREGVWVTSFDCAMPLATALRLALEQASRERTLEIDRSQKMQVLFQHICSVEFRQIVEAILQSQQAMRFDLDREKRAMQKIWAVRERQLESMSTRTIQLFGGVQGIVGAAALPDIPVLELDEE